MKQYLKCLKYLAAGVFLAYGRYPVSWLLSAGKTKQKPKILRAQKTSYITCSSGNCLQIQFDGNENGNPIVLIHGLNSNSQQWYYQRLMLRRQYKLVLIDLPGHGGSGKAVDLSISAMAHDIRTVLERLALKDVILYGHSMGVMIILEYLKRWKSADLKAVILQHGSYTNPLKSGAFSNFMQKIEYPVIRPLLRFIIKYPAIFNWLAIWNHGNGISVAFYSYLHFTGRQSAAQLRFLSRLALTCPADVLAAGILQTLDFNAENILPEIELPVVAIGAANDRIIHADALRFISSKVRWGVLAKIPGGHQSMIEFPARLNCVLKYHLDLLAT
jgi:pimeloyl-ACP methyl ester carboxylesterase